VEEKVKAVMPCVVMICCMIGASQMEGVRYS
jgi:hypothetical protein